METTEFSPRRDILTSNPEVAYFEGAGRTKNLESSLKSHEVISPDFWKNIKGKSVLIKINLASPENPESCTSPEALRVVMQELASKGVSHIQVADLPMVEAMPDLQSYEDEIRLYEKLGYLDVIESIEKSFPEIRVTVGFPIKEYVDLNTPSELRILKIENDAVVNLTQPKEHGQYYFSGSCKNLMGLVHPDDRISYFHNHTPASEIQETVRRDQFVNSLKSRQTSTSPRSDMSTQSEQLRILAELYSKANLDVSVLHDQENFRKMSQFIHAALTHLNHAGVPILTVMDGTFFMSGQEHRGTSEYLDIAAVGLNPVAVDQIMLDRLCIKSDYINILTKGNILYKASGDKPYKIKGFKPSETDSFLQSDRERRQPNIRYQKRKLVDFKIHPDGKYTFRYAIESQSPPSGLSNKSLELQRHPNNEYRSRLMIQKDEEHLAIINDILSIIRNGSYGKNNRHLEHLHNSISSQTHPLLQRINESRKILELNPLNTTQLNKENYGILSPREEFDILNDIHSIVASYHLSNFDRDVFRIQEILENKMLFLRGS